jgi:hypothetical protein
MGREVEALDDKLRQMLRDLSRALYEAISDSSEVGESLRRIRREGYTLHLLLDCKRDERDERAERVEREVPARGAAERALPDPLAVAAEIEPAAPSFRIDGKDLLFLRSIGIDPTRRRRRRPRPALD